MTKVRKKIKSAKDVIDEKSIGKFEDLTEEDKLLFLAESFKIAKNAMPNYEHLKDEINEFEVEILDEPDVANISEINKLYALGQSYSNRVSTVKRIALSNIDNWQQLMSDIKMFIRELEWDWDEKESQTLLLDEVKKLPNDRTRQAYVKNKYSEDHKRLHNANKALAKVDKYLGGAKSFKSIVEVKEKELVSALMNLNRQVEALKAELSITRN